MNEAGIATFLEDVRREVVTASEKNGPFNSLHEAYAVLLEEVDEVWEIVKQKPDAIDKIALYHELKQVAAMATRAASELVMFNPERVAPRTKGRKRQ